MTAYLEHAAIEVADLVWHIRFFEEVCSPCRVTMREHAPGKPNQVWLLGGLQIIEIDSVPGSGRLNHLALATADPTSAIEKARSAGAVPDPRGENWLRLPEGLVIEILEATAARGRGRACTRPAGGMNRSWWWRVSWEDVRESPLR